MDDTTYVRYSRITSVFWGLVCLLFAFFAGGIADTVIEAINKVSSAFYGPILGAFLLAILTKRTNAFGANVGIICGVLFNFYLWFNVPEVFWFWWNAIGGVITVSIGMLASRLYKHKKVLSGLPEPEPIEWKSPFVYGLLAFFVLIVIFSLCIPWLF